MRAQNILLRKGYFATVIALAMAMLFRVSVYAADGAKLNNDSSETITIKHYPVTVEGSVGTTTRNHLGSYSEALRNVYTFWDDQKLLNVASFSSKGLCVQVYDSSFQVKKEFTLQPRYEKFGGITCDSNGNYFVVWAQYDDKADNCVTMSISKYNSSGGFLKELLLSGYDTDNYGDNEYGTRYPFQFGNTSLAIQNGILALNYARVMYSGHQSNLVVYVDCNSMERKYADTCYTSHSFDQRAYATADGNGFVFLNQGDAYYRGFKLSYINLSSIETQKKSWYTGGKSIYSFHFREGATRYQEIFSQMGGMAEVNAGYVFLGASERALDFVENPRNAQYIDGRDLFIQVLKKDFSNYSGADQYALVGETRTAQKNTSSTTAHYFDENSVDYGVVWLTNYDSDHYAANPKVVAIGDEKFAILWEKRSYSSGSVSTYFAVMDASGKVIRNSLMLQDCLLAADTDPVFKDGKIYWTTQDNYGFRINELDVNASSQAYHDHEYEEVSREGNNVALKCKICGGTRSIVTTSEIQFYLNKNGGGYMWSSAYESNGFAVDSGDKVGVWLKYDSGSTDIIEVELSDGKLATFEDGSTKMSGTDFPVIVTKAGGKARVTITPKYVSNPVTKTFYLNISGEPPVSSLEGNVSILGKLICGETLTAQVSDSNNSGVLSYQWMRGDDGIGDATSSQYVLTNDDVGQIISCVVTSSVETGSISGTAIDKVKKAEFTMAGANMNLGNELAMSFFIKKSDIDESKNYYVKVTKTYADGRDDVVRIFQKADWVDYSSSLYRIIFNGLAAKEMNDKIYVQVFYEDDTAVSKLWTDSVADYVLRIFDKQNDKTKKMLADMLNYGSAAQAEFHYDESNLAVNRLTAEQKAYLSDSASYMDSRVKGNHYVGSNLNLGSNLLMSMYFSDVTPDMYAIVSFTSHTGAKVEYRIEGSEFILQSGSTYRILIDRLAVADGRQPVTCTVYKASGEVFGSATDSMESYIARMSSSSALYETIMKFSISAYNYFH